MGLNESNSTDEEKDYEKVGLDLIDRHLNVKTSDKYIHFIHQNKILQNYIYTDLNPDLKKWLNKNGEIVNKLKKYVYHNKHDKLKNFINSLDDNKSWYTIKQKSGNLFIDEHGLDSVKMEDVIQGDIGDCYFANGLSMIALRYPDRIKECIKDNKDGTYTVKLYKFKRDKIPREIIVNNYFYVTSMETEYGRPFKNIYLRSRSNTLWAPLIEKAYAILMSENHSNNSIPSYEYIQENNSFTANKAIETILGYNISKNIICLNNDDISNMGKTKIWNIIKNCIKNKKMIFGGTRNYQFMKYRSGLYSNHSYSIINTFERGSQKFIMLRDPQGPVILKCPCKHVDITYNSKKYRDGKCELLFVLFMTHFESLSYEI